MLDKTFGVQFTLAVLFYLFSACVLGFYGLFAVFFRLARSFQAALSCFYGLFAFFFCLARNLAVALSCFYGLFAFFFCLARSFQASPSCFDFFFLFLRVLLVLALYTRSFCGCYLVFYAYLLD